ncbi:PH domain-containing protein [Mesobacillus maritimus]|uniref:PH domain-containing protein n=1 Tax=Mesobacillus maritimus TaxID=1643336 RepID=UPI0038504A25
MSDPKRLHPIAAIINMLRQLKELIVPILFITIFGGRGNEGLFYFIAVGGGLGLVLLSGFLSWYRFTYRVEEGELRIEHGLFVRKKRYIPFERIQSIDVSEGILQRPFGLVKVKVETAGGARTEDAEAVLTAIRKEEANHIHELLVSVKNSQLGNESSEEEVPIRESIIYKLSPGDLLLLASTSGGVGVVISAVIAFFFQFEEIIPYEKLYNEVEHFIANGIFFISIVVFLGFLVAWVISVIMTMLKYANFTLKKVDQDLIITRGLLEKRQITIPLKRIQAIRISENILRQPLGMASVYVESAGGSALNEEGSKVLVLPLIKKQQIAKTLEPFLEGYPFRTQLNKLPSRAFSRYLIKGVVLVIPIVIVVSYLFRPWGYASSLLILPSVIWSALKFKDAGWALEKDSLTLRYRTLVKSTVLMRREKVQSLTARKSFFQNKKRLATIEAVVKSGHSGSGGCVNDLEDKDVEVIYHWFSRDVHH